MSSYTLTYFDSRLRGELARWVLSAAGQSWEDVRLDYMVRDEFNALKPKAPFGQLPLLETEGVILCQSNSIARFLAKRYGYAGNDDVEEAKVNMIVDYIEDMLPFLEKYTVFSKTEEEKKAAKTIWDEKRPMFLDNFEKILNANKDGNGYFVGNEMTWADMAFSIWVAYIEDFDPMTYPKLAALKTKTESDPGIAAWIAKRPDTF